MSLPKGWAPMTGDTSEARDLKDKVAKANPSLGKQLESMASMPNVQLIALDSGQLDGKSGFVDNINVNVTPSDNAEWKEDMVPTVTAAFKHMISDDKLESNLVEVDGKKVL